jgi:polyisoprenoid-binding protein YceI
MSCARAGVALDTLMPTLALVLAAQVAQGQSVAELARLRYDADPQHSTVGFTTRVFGAAKVRGRFRDYDATIIYDPDHLERWSVTAVIQTKSIDTDMDFRDNHLRSPDFFDAATYPTIVFQSDRVERTSTGYQAVGRFTMHGVTRPLVLPITVVLQPVTRGNTGTVAVAFEATARLSRKAFGIAGTNKFNPSFDPAVSMLPDSVDVNIELLAHRAGYLTWTFDGQTPPSIADTVGRVLAARGIDSAVRVYRALHASAPKRYNFGAGQLNALGNQLLERGRVPDAVRILALNDEMYPSEEGVTAALADAYAWAGDGDRAVAAYRRALRVDSMDPGSIEMLRHLTPPGGPTPAPTAAPAPSPTPTR